MTGNELNTMPTKKPTKSYHLRLIDDPDLNANTINEVLRLAQKLAFLLPRVESNIPDLNEEDIKLLETLRLKNWF